MTRFVRMLTGVRRSLKLTQREMAVHLGISPSYLNDIEHGRRLPSVNIVENICGFLDSDPPSRMEWHMAGAQAHGWSVE